LRIQTVRHDYPNSLELPLPSPLQWRARGKDGEVMKLSQSKIIGISAIFVGAVWISLQVRLVVLVDIHRGFDGSDIISILLILSPAMFAVFYGAKILINVSKVNI